MLLPIATVFLLYYWVGRLVFADGTKLTAMELWLELDIQLIPSSSACSGRSGLVEWLLTVESWNYLKGETYAKISKRNNRTKKLCRKYHDSLCCIRTLLLWFFRLHFSYQCRWKAFCITMDVFIRGQRCDGAGIVLFLPPFVLPLQSFVVKVSVTACSN